MNPQDVTVGQILFCYGFNAKGLQLEASSLEAEQANNWWFNELKTFIRLYWSTNQRRPSSALSYYILDADHAAVVFRIDRGVSDGRNDSHVLVGSPRVLGPELAINLRSWAGWFAPDLKNSPLPSYHADEFLLLDRQGKPLADVAAASALIRQEAAGEPYHQPVASILARMLNEPGRPVSVWGRDELDALVIVWALRDVGEHALHEYGADLRWTFSTWETKHDVPGLPEIVFLPEKQTNVTASVDRVQIDLNDAQAPSHLLRYAHGLIRHRFFGEAPPDAPTVEAPVAMSSTGLPPSRASGPESAPPAQVGRSVEQIPFREGERVPASPATPGTRTREAQANMSAKQDADVDNQGARAGWPGDDYRSQPLTASPGGEMARLAAGLARAETIDEFRKAVVAVREKARQPAERAEVRAALIQSFEVNGIGELADVRAPAELIKSAMGALYGEAGKDLRDGGGHSHTHAAAMIGQSQSSLLARQLTEIGLRHEPNGGEITTAAAHRLTVDATTAPASTSSIRSNGLGWPRSFIVAAAVATTLALVVGLILGAFLFGGRASSDALQQQSAGALQQQLSDLQAKVDGLQSKVAVGGQPQPTTGTGSATVDASVPTFPWSGKLPLSDKVKAVLLYVKGSDTLYRGIKCAFDPGLPPDQLRDVRCEKPGGSGDHGVGAVIVTTDGTVPSFDKPDKEIPAGLVPILVFGSP